MTAPCAGCQKPAPEIQTGNGLVGTELHSMLSLLGIQADDECDCESFAREMDSWGVDGCVERRIEIMTKLEHARTKTTWLQNLGAALFAIRTGVAAKINPVDPIPGLVDEAIRRAARKIGRPDPQQVRRPHVNKHRGMPDPFARLTPLPAAFSDVRNLIYHIWPTRKSDAWKWNVRELLKRIDLFNGVRTIGVAVDASTATLAEVQAEFGDIRIDHWISRPNDPQAGEGGTFLEMLATLPRDQSVTCYAHAKGVKYEAGNTVPLKWADVLYRSTFDNWPMVFNALSHFPVVGTFKRYGHFKLPRNHCWHFSGTFFWFRNGETFNRPEWAHLQKSFYGCVEAWPANVYRPTEAACMLGDNAGNLYDPHEVAKHDRELTFREQVFAADKTADIGSGVSDAVYYGESVRRGYTEWHWPVMLETHQRGAAFIRHELQCNTALELGSGLGGFLVGSKAIGLRARGMDVNILERGFAISKGVAEADYEVSQMKDYKITQPVDCIYTAEVFEHCTDAELRPICEQIAANCKWFYFTSTPYATTPEADLAWGHINMKTKEQWIEFFKPYGLVFDRDDRSVVEWGLVFRSAV